MLIIVSAQSRKQERERKREKERQRGQTEKKVERKRKREGGEVGERAVYIRTLILHLNNTIGKINKRARRAVVAFTRLRSRDRKSARGEE